MRPGFLAKKIGMTQVFTSQGALIPVTVLDSTSCVITQVKSSARDGYAALQVGFGEQKPQNQNKPQKGHLAKAKVKSALQCRELRFEKDSELAAFHLGSQLSTSLFEQGDKLDATATTKGKGFQGVMKRLGFKGKDASHGTHEYFRHAGSAGSNTFPGRIFRNKGMPGQTGNWQETVQAVEVVSVQGPLILVKGAVPGSRGSVVMLRWSKKNKQAYPASRFTSAEKAAASQAAS